MSLAPKQRGFGWLPYVWLVYLAGIPLYAWKSHAGAWQWTFALLGMAIFLPLYFRGHHAGPRGRLGIITAIALLGTVTAPVNPNAGVYFIYAASFAGLAADTALTIKVVGLLLAVVGGEALAFHLGPYFFVPAAVFAVMIGAITTSTAQRQRDQERLLKAQEEVEQMARIAERERIGRDLHDVLGHSLSVIVLKSELASKLAETDPERAIREIRDVETISRETLAELRSTVRGYQERSLRTEVERAESALRAAGVHVSCSVAEVGLPSSLEGVLALVLREAVTNVIRHAGATKCELTLAQNGDTCRLEIKDNGKGQPAPEGVGLSGIRARVEAVGGNFRREVGLGTQLIITFPMSAT